MNEPFRNFQELEETILLEQMMAKKESQFIAAFC